MKLDVTIEIKGEVDTLMLWSLIEKYKMNLTAVEDKTWIYGEVDYTTLGHIIKDCALFGDVEAEIKH